MIALFLSEVADHASSAKSGASQVFSGEFCGFFQSTLFINLYLYIKTNVFHNVKTSQLICIASTDWFLYDGNHWSLMGYKTPSDEWF